jgi:hypothetical protein
MKNIENGRAAWSKPELRRIDAGSAENKGGTGNDGDPNTKNNKS